ncbi:uncharacterized protein LOC118435923 [Folsomia candida]|uniref:uncharacterized protein LOC118435923 n=1 Tax=Folsomia candida TaxID=158441 RepID=UPI001604B235|nr:uncharacterized protein LOC118435923 [Folsomia candida]
MDHLLQRVTQLEKMVSELVNWTNYTTTSVPTGNELDGTISLSHTSVDSRQLINDQFDIEEGVKIEAIEVASDEEEMIPLDLLSHDPSDNNPANPGESGSNTFHFIDHGDPLADLNHSTSSEVSNSASSTQVGT